jgi:hypothetical protein
MALLRTLRGCRAIAGRARTSRSGGAARQGRARTRTYSRTRVRPWAKQRKITDTHVAPSQGASQPVRPPAHVGVALALRVKPAGPESLGLRDQRPARGRAEPRTTPNSRPRPPQWHMLRRDSGARTVTDHAPIRVTPTASPPPLLRYLP